ncbi:hypothetical protein H5410_024272 [Solanum commersonii]|uniref:Uncharacterized protein n=1 Tax=Solanum commersonii TaxID=4109 RepID=A0A9J5ZLI4_SOLCO|nr:hypothetical protein H5410_024272 [Solanum commersonii]
MHNAMYPVHNAMYPTIWNVSNLMYSVHNAMHPNMWNVSNLMYPVHNAILDGAEDFSKITLDIGKELRMNPLTIYVDSASAHDPTLDMLLLFKS